MTQFQITTADRVKVQAQIAGTSLDAFIGTLIDQVSAMAQEYLGRKLEFDSYTEVIPLRARKRYVSLLGFPLDSVQSVKYAPTRDFSAVDAMDTAGYQVLTGEGQIYLSGLTTWFDPGFIQVTYMGGMAEDTTEFVGLFPRIAGAADNEIIARLNRRKTPDGNLTAMGAQIGYTEQLAPLTDFHSALDPHRRLRL